MRSAEAAEAFGVLAPLLRPFERLRARDLHRQPPSAAAICGHEGSEAKASVATFQGDRDGSRMWQILTTRYVSYVSSEAPNHPSSLAGKVSLSLTRMSAHVTGLSLLRQSAWPPLQHEPFWPPEVCWDANNDAFDSSPSQWCTASSAASKPCKAARAASAPPADRARVR